MDVFTGFTPSATDAASEADMNQLAQQQILSEAETGRAATPAMLPESD